MVEAALPPPPPAPVGGDFAAAANGGGHRREPRYLSGLQNKLAEILAQKKISQREFDVARAALNEASVEAENIGYKPLHYTRDDDGVIRKD